MTRPQTVLYLVRHGESEANAARRYAGQTDSPLTARGRRQAEEVAAALRDVRLDRVLSSDLSRARDTAAAIARDHGLRVEVFPELREVDVGEAAGRPILQRTDNFDAAGRFVQWPDGESLEQVASRVLSALDRIVAASPGKTVCIVGHGGVTRVLVSHFLGMLPELYTHATPTRNTSVTVVRTDGITYRVESLFASDHLRDGSGDRLSARNNIRAVPEDLGSKIRDVPDFPKPGILFKDITTLLKDGQAFKASIDGLLDRVRGKRIDVVVGMESRGLIFGAPIAYALGVGFVPVRKLGKLPAEVVSVEYDLEYGSATLEMHRDAIRPGQRVLIVDDLLATGGTVAGTIELVKQLHGEIVALAFLVELRALRGRDRLDGYDITTLIEY